MKEEWLMPGAVVPVDVETTSALVAEIKRLIGIVGGLALNQKRTWVGLTDEEIAELHHAIKVQLMGTYKTEDIYRVIEAKLKEKNGG